MSDIDQACRSAYDLINAGRAADAVALMAPVAEASPGSANAQRMYGLALAAAGDADAGEARLRAVLVLSPKAAQVHGELAGLLLKQGKAAEAAAAMRDALSLAPHMAPAASTMAQQLIASGMASDALALTAALGQAPTARGLHAEALLFTERYEDARAEAENALARNAGAARTHFILGKALQGLGRFDEAEASYRAGLAVQPNSAELHRELAQLIWMRTENAGAAVAALDEALARYPHDTNLPVVKAKLLEFAGKPEAGLAALAPALNAPRTPLHVSIAAAQLAMHFDADAALAHAVRALHEAPDDVLAMITAAEANLAAGRAEAAAKLAERAHIRAPENQHAVALLATAWRLLGDDRYGALYDYGALVRTWRLDTPANWPTLDAWLDDFEAALNAMHELRAHPIGQSLRGGSQANQSLETSDHSAVRGFFEAIDGPIRRHIAAIGAGDDVLRTRSRGGYRLAGAWSVRLRPGGVHVSHVHPAGWLSSACYVALPDAVDGDGKQGWLAFGEPGIPTMPTLGPEHWVRPERGMLVLFPSYMWHGTTPFSGEKPRLTCAFDVAPG